MKIITKINCIGLYDAIDDDTYDYDAPIGYGETEAEAIADLKEQLEDLVDDGCT